MPNALEVAGRLARRRATALDVDFLRSVFAEARPELALLPEPAREQLIGMQFTSQLQQYRRDVPDAIDWILELDDGNGAEPIGRCYLWQGPSEHRLLDLAVAERFRRQGLGRRVLEWLQADAARAGVPLRLSVWHANHDARRLYHRHGFAAEGDGRDAGPAGYLRLSWSAGDGR